MGISVNEPADVNKIISMFAKIDTESRFTLLEPGERNLNREFQESFLASVNQNKNLVMFVLESEERYHGYIVGKIGEFKRNSKTMSVVIGIEKESTNKGYGKLLMNRLIKKAMEKGIRRMELTVIKENIPAIKLYEKCGFCYEGIKRERVMIDGNFFDEVAMAKLLCN